MRAALQYAGWLVGIPLELLIIAALVRGSYRRFPLILVYSIVLFLTTVVEISVYQAFRAGVHVSHSWAHYYWIDEGLRQGSMFAVVIGLIYSASVSLRARAVLRAFLIFGAVIFAATSFWVHYGSHNVVGEWMTLWTRDLDFSAAVLDLALWAMLLGSHNRDNQLLLLSGSLGIQFTGEALGQSLRYFLPWTLSPGDVVMLVANLAGMWIWWQALKGAPWRHATA